MLAYLYVDLMVDYIKQHGWIRGREEDHQGHVCTMGAMGRVVPVELHRDLHDKIMPVVTKTAEHSTIPSWNDQPNMDQDMIIAALEGCSAVLKAAGTRLEARESKRIPGLKSLVWPEMSQEVKKQMTKKLIDNVTKNNVFFEQLIAEEKKAEKDKKFMEMYSGFDIIAVDEMTNFVEPIKSGNGAAPLSQLVTSEKAKAAKKPSGLLAQMVAQLNLVHY